MKITIASNNTSESLKLQEIKITRNVLDKKCLERKLLNLCLKERQ